MNLIVLVHTSPEYSATAHPFCFMILAERSNTSLHVLPDLQQKLQRVLDDLLQLAQKLSTNRAVHNLVVKAAGDGDLVVPRNARGAVLRLGGNSDLLRGTDSQNGRLGRVDDGGEVVDGRVHAHVGDGDGATLVLLGLQLAVAGTLGEVLDGGGDGLESLSVGGFDNGGDQTSGSRDSDGDVDGVVLADRLTLPGGVDGGDLLGSSGDGLDEEVVDAELVLALGGRVERLAELHELAHGDCRGDEEVGVLADGLLQTVCDGLAHAAEGEVLVGSSGGASSRRGGSGLLDVVLGDLATGAGALQAGQLDALLNGESLGGGGRVGLARKGSLELAAEAGGVGLGGGLGDGCGRGLFLLGLLLLWGGRGGGLTTGIGDCEALESGDIGSLLNVDSDRLRTYSQQA